MQRLADTEQAAGLGAVDPEQESMAQEERLAVRKALAQLSEREQACLVLRHSGLSYAEVASALGVRTGSVGTLLARAGGAVSQGVRKPSGCLMECFESGQLRAFLDGELSDMQRANCNGIWLIALVAGML